MLTGAPLAHRAPLQFLKVDHNLGAAATTFNQEGDRGSEVDTKQSGKRRRTIVASWVPLTLAEQIRARAETTATFNPDTKATEPATKSTAPIRVATFDC